VTKNLDGYWFSVFFHKDRNGKLKAGPVWDYDLSFGNQVYEYAYHVDKWVWERMGQQYTWFRRLFDDPDFVQAYIDRWPHLRSTVFATSNVLALIDRFAAEIREPVKRNYERWPTLGERIAGNAFADPTWEASVDRLKTWISNRLEWIDTQDFPKPAMVVDGEEEREKGGKGGGGKFQIPSSKLQRSSKLQWPSRTIHPHGMLSGEDILYDGWERSAVVGRGGVGEGGAVH
jgi:hypothetical protein